MKGIKKTLIAGAFACAAFNAHAEVSPWAYGVKGLVGGSSAINHSKEVKINDKNAQNSLITDLSFGGNVYGEFAFANYFGLGVELGYLKQGATLKEGAEKKEGDDVNKDKNNNSISIDTHAINAQVLLQIYPMGREDEIGIPKISLGLSPLFRFNTVCKAHGQEVKLNDDQKKELRNIDLAATAGVGYEFPFALSIEAKYNYGFMNLFAKETQTIFDSKCNVSGLKKMHMHCAVVTLGYNLAPLFCS